MPQSTPGFVPDLTGTLIGFVHDPNCIIDSVVGVGVGAYGSVRGSALMPPIGSSVELVVDCRAGREVIAARWGMLLVAALSILAAWGATSPHGQPSALRVEVTAVIGLLAPLFWPGRGASGPRTALRVVAWSAAAAASAAIVLLAHPAQPWGRVVSACAMLMAILVLAHAAAAAIERGWNGTAEAGGIARELAGPTVTGALAVLGTSPFWLGPAAESLSTRHPGIIDLVVGLSPVTHLAIASGNDLLHNPWLYEHSNLAVLPVSYPELGTLAWGYATACAALAMIVLASRRSRRTIPAIPIDPTQEQSR